MPFANYLRTALDQIRVNAKDALAIYLRLFAVLGTIVAQGYGRG